MPISERNKDVNATDTVSALNAPESNFQTSASRAGDYTGLVTQNNKCDSEVVEEEGMIPHN